MKRGIHTLDVTNSVSFSFIGVCQGMMVIFKEVQCKGFDF